MKLREKKSIAPTFTLNRRSAAAQAKLIIVDECSMVDEQLARDLMSFRTPILVLGDPGQLPPISGGGFFFQWGTRFSSLRNSSASER